MEHLVINNVVKNYGKVKALEGISVGIKKGGILGVLGPSGSGKSTLLKCIAGIETPDSGEIWIDGRCVFSSEKRINTSPDKRRIGFVFQNYALWPHMSVRKNISYPLKMMKIPGPDTERRVSFIMEMMRLSGKEERYPHELSGGEQQRVALGRAVIMDPSLLLLDEPLSNLDLRLREEMQAEITRLQQELNLTAVHVTHDQGEALGMSDNLVVMNNGLIEQAGLPGHVYRNPCSEFVAGFLGRSNFIDGCICRRGNGLVLEGPEDFAIPLCGSSGQPQEGTSGLFSFRPESIRIFPDSEGGWVITENIYKGSSSLCEIEKGGITLRVICGPEEPCRKGLQVSACIDSITSISENSRAALKTAGAHT